MLTLLPLITSLIGEAPAVVNLIMSLVHPDGSQTILVTLGNADANDQAAMTAIQQLQAAVATKNVTSKQATPAKTT